MEIINKDDNIKMITFIDKKDIYQVTKKQIDEQNLEKYTKIPDELIFSNDKIKKYELNDAIIIKTENFDNVDKKKMIDKKFCVVNETPEMYHEHFKLLIKQNEIPVKWIHNILNDEAEIENVLLKSNDFYLTKDMKWNGNPENLYLLVIFKDETLYSIRSLSSEHITMLENTKKIVIDFCKKNYNISEDKLKLYFHYHPSYWHLHLHIEITDSKIGKDSTFYAETLNDVLYNLKLTSDYYKNKIITIMKHIN